MTLGVEANTARSLQPAPDRLPRPATSASVGRAALAAAANAGSCGFVFTLLLARSDVLVALAVLGVISAP